MAANQGEYLNAREAAWMLGITEAALSYQRGKGTGPKVVSGKGGQFFYKESDLISYLEHQRDASQTNLDNGLARLKQIKEQRTGD